MFQKSLLIVSLCLFTLMEGSAQGLLPLPADKAVVYIGRPSKLGSFIEFLFFDGETCIGKFNSRKYLRYECEPGKHVFWGRSMNQDYVEADLEAGKTYVIMAEPVFAALGPKVDLIPLTMSANKISLKRIRKLVEKQAPEILTEELLKPDEEQLPNMIKEGMEGYEEKRASGSKMDQLSAEHIVVWE